MSFSEIFFLSQFTSLIYSVFSSLYLNYGLKNIEKTRDCVSLQVPNDLSSRNPRDITLGVKNLGTIWEHSTGVLAL